MGGGGQMAEETIGGLEWARTPSAHSAHYPASLVFTARGRAQSRTVFTLPGLTRTHEHTRTHTHTQTHCKTILLIVKQIHSTEKKMSARPRICATDKFYLVQNKC